MFGDIYPMKYMGKTTGTFRRMKFWLPQILPFSAKTYASSGESKIELLILVSDCGEFYIEKYSKVFL